MSQENYDPELAALEAALTALKPAASELDRDRLMYEAGRRSLRGRVWGWPLAALAMTGVAAALGVVLLTRPEPQVIERTVVQRVEAPTPSTPNEVVTPAREPQPMTALDSSSSPRGTDYLKLRKQVLLWGVEVLPQSPPAAGSTPPLTVDSLLDSLNRPHSRRPLPTQPGDRS